MCKLQSLLSGTHTRLLRSAYDEIDDTVVDRSSEVFAGAEPTSACLWSMVNGFLEVDYNPAACELPVCNTSTAGTKSSITVLKAAIQEMESLLGESSGQVAAVEAKIASCVAKALTFSSRNNVGEESAHSEQALLTVIKYLQREGYNAGLCMTTRKPGNAAAGVSPTGGHRYIDVILEEELTSGTLGKRPPLEKLIVDVGFSAHFEIARPLPAYQKLMDLLPSTFIGKSACLQKVVRVMSQAAKASLESQGMSIPPWRSFSFLLAKWLSSSYSRITSVDKANMLLNTSPANHVKPHVLTELDYNADLANFADSPANEDGCEGGSKSFFLKVENAAEGWCPPSPSNQIPVKYDTSSSYIPKRRQASVTSGLSLAFAETQVTHNMCAAGA